jgi:hypothetical protein
MLPNKKQKNNHSVPGSSGEGSLGWGPSAVNSPVLVGPSLVFGPGVPPRRLSSGDSDREGPAVPGRGHDISASSRVEETVGLAPEGAQFIKSGLSTEDIETILQSRAPSMNKLYAFKWRLFTSWCREHQLDPVNCPVGSVLEFLQEHFSAGLCLSIMFRICTWHCESLSSPKTGLCA